MATYNQYTDEKLLQLLQKEGDRDIFAEIYKRHSKRLIEIGFYFTQDRGLVEEIVDDVFLSLWNRKDNLEILSLKHYLNTAVKFSIFKSLERSRRRRELMKTYVAPQFTQEEEARMEARFTEIYLNEVLESLPEKTRLIYQYSRQQEMTVVDISKAMNMQPKAVEYHITKSLKRLRSALHTLNSSNICLLLAVLFSSFF